MAEEQPELDYEDEEDAGAFGPALPPPSPDETAECADYGPALPPSMATIGPQIPAHLLASARVEKDDEELPALATERSESSSSDDDGAEEGLPAIGPALPPADGPTRADDFAPALPPGFQGAQEEWESESDGDYGPQLPGQTEDYEDRLRELKTKEALKKHKNRREEWMTELPSGGLKSFGLGARTFSKASGRDKEVGTDEWTKAPEDALLGESSTSAAAKSAQSASSAARDSELAAKAAALNAGRTESLVQQHTRKRGGDEGETSTSGKKERRPFDRDADVLGPGLGSLGPGGVKKSVEQAGQLSSRFGHGDEQKYL